MASGGAAGGTGGAPRVVVVGAGVAGCATAAALAGRGARVTVVDRGGVAGASSGLSAGVFNRQTPNVVEQALRCETVVELGRMEAAGELPLAREGYVRVATRDEDVDRLAAAETRGRELGVQDARLVGPDELARLVPGIRVDDVRAALHCPSDGHLDGALLCAAYLARARAAGASLRTGAAVRGIELGPGGARVRLEDGTLACDVVVNAAGAWADRVAALAGVRLPLVNQRHEIAIAHLPEPVERPYPMVNLYVPGSGRRALWFRSEGATRLLVGAHAHEVLAGHEVDDPDRYGRQGTFGFLEDVAEELADRLPGVPDLRLEAGWAGLYPTSPDALPQVGPHADAPRLVSVAGLNGTGLTVSAAVGRIAAAWILDGEARCPHADALLPDRPALRPGAARA